MPSRTLRTLVACLACTALALCSCGGGRTTAANEFYHIADGVWDTQDTAIFVIDSICADGNYQLSVALRTSNEVQFQKIHLVAVQQYDKPLRYAKDTLTVQLTDDTGKMLGAGLGLCNYLTAAKGTLRLRKGQGGHIKIYHIMRRTQLSGIIDIGIKLTNENSRN